MDEKCAGSSVLKGASAHCPDPGTAAVPGCEWRGVRAPAIGSGGETPPELAGEDACDTGGSGRMCPVPNSTVEPHATGVKTVVGQRRNQQNAERNAGAADSFFEWMMARFPSRRDANGN